MAIPDLAEISKLQKEIDLTKAKFDENFESSKYCNKLLKCIFDKTYWKYSEFYKYVNNTENKIDNTLLKNLKGSSFGFVQTNHILATNILKECLPEE